MKDKFYSVLPHVAFVLILAASGYLMMNASSGIPFFILASSFIIYAWSRELLGKWWALLPTFLFGFSPIVLNQGRYITALTAAVFGFLLASYLFIKFLNSRTNKHLFWAGIGLGIALFINAYNIVLIPTYLVILFFFWLGETIRMKSSNMGDYKFMYFVRRALSLVGDFILIIIVALALIYIINFIPNLNFTYPVTQYLSEISTAIHSSISVVRSNSLIKSFSMNMLPMLILLILSMFFGLENMVARFKGGKLISKFAEYLGTNFAEFGCLIMAVLYSAYIIKYSANNSGFESFLPILPFVCILIASSLKNWLNRNHLFQ